MHSHAGLAQGDQSSKAAHQMLAALIKNRANLLLLYKSRRFPVS
jgi:hypothetical protein